MTHGGRHPEAGDGVKPPICGGVGRRVLAPRRRLEPRISSSARRRRSRHGQGELATVGVRVVAHADLVVAVGGHAADENSDAGCDDEVTKLFVRSSDGRGRRAVPRMPVCSVRT